MVDLEPRVGDQRPGGRAARVRSTVLESASEVLLEMGYEHLTIDSVAERAGVHKTTIYRRWSTKAELVADAVRVHTDRNVPIPDTGTVIGDLRALVRAVVDNIGSEAGARRTRSLVAAAANSAELAPAMHLFWAERLGASVAIVERAIERGELPARTDPNLIIEAVIGPIWVRFLLTGEPVDDALADRVVDLVINGAT